ncbi:MAG: hypothetical protein ACI9YL_000532 [Luteibaculaceae bacterium]|jgi:hypothetical protein
MLRPKHAETKTVELPSRISSTALKSNIVRISNLFLCNTGKLLPDTKRFFPRKVWTKNSSARQKNELISGIENTYWIFRKIKIKLCRPLITSKKQEILFRINVYNRNN